MLKTVKSNQVKASLPKRKLNSHKGENGKLLVVGGSIDYYAPPVLAALGALNSGVDIATVVVPEVNFDVTRSLSMDLIVKKYPGESLTLRYTDMIIEMAKNFDAILIGPGLGKAEKNKESVKEIVKKVKIPTVLDADAISVLKMINNFPLEQPIAITPHIMEFRNLVDREVELNEKNSKGAVLLRSISMDLGINVLLKGPTDFISSAEGGVEINKTGNPGMTVGGSGDVLAGVVSSLMAQGVDTFEACRAGAYYVGKAGDLVMKHKGFNFLASDIVQALPAVLN